MYFNPSSISKCIAFYEQGFLQTLRNKAAKHERSSCFFFLKMSEMQHLDFPANVVLGCLKVNLLPHRVESLGVAVKAIELLNRILVTETDISQNIALA